jgi:Carbamoyl-phosphate synthase L chain, ATP binding domain
MIDPTHGPVTVGSVRLRDETHRMRVLVTNAESKHSIALQRYLRAELKDVSLVGHEEGSTFHCRHHGKLDEIRGGPLSAVLERRDFDMVIPVGGSAVAAVVSTCPDLGVLPQLETVTRAFDKGMMTALALSLGIPVPRTMVIRGASEAAGYSLGFPCVIRPANETRIKMVAYADSPAELETEVRRLFSRMPEGVDCGVLLQNRVAGVGRGFFAVYDRGRAMRVFMHERIREDPPSGGPSTAARAIRDPRLHEYGTKVLNALNWHGPAMVEFKYEPASGEYYLIEINPKLWGSLELTLRAGVNVGALLVRLFRGEKLGFSAAYDDEVRFYWPLDGDLSVIRKYGRPAELLDYLRLRARTNLFQSPVSDLKKLADLLRILWRSGSR